MKDSFRGRFTVTLCWGVVTFCCCISSWANPSSLPETPGQHATFNSIQPRPDPDPAAAPGTAAARPQLAGNKAALALCLCELIDGDCLWPTERRRLSTLKRADCLGVSGPGDTRGPTDPASTDRSDGTIVFNSSDAAWHDENQIWWKKGVLIEEATHAVQAEDDGQPRPGGAFSGDTYTAMQILAPAYREAEAAARVIYYMKNHTSTGGATQRARVRAALIHWMGHLQKQIAILCGPALRDLQNAVVGQPRDASLLRRINRCKKKAKRAFNQGHGVLSGSGGSPFTPYP